MDTVSNRIIFFPHAVSLRTYFILFLVVVLVGCSQGSGTPSSSQSIYIDATLGNDTTGNGSMELPYQSFAPLTKRSYAVPTTIYLKRGEVWNETLTLPGSNITVTAYDTGALPQINGSRQVYNWTFLSPGYYYTVLILNPGEAFGNLSENGVMMNFVPWNSDLNTTFTGAPFPSYSYLDSTQTLYIKTSLTYPNQASYLASMQLYGIYATGRSDISIQNVDVTRTSLHGIEFYDCVRCSVTDSTLENIGGVVIDTNPSTPPDYLYAGNGIDYSDSSTNGQVSNVIVTDIFDSCLAVEVFTKDNIADSITLENAQLSKCGFAGVELSVLDNQGTNINSQINNVAVSNVTVNNAGKGWSGQRYGTAGHGMRIVADQNAGTMSGISVQTSTFNGSAGDGIKIAGEVGVVDLHRINANTNDGIGINVLDANAATLGLKISSSLIYSNAGNGISYNAPNGAGLQVYHTTFYDNGGTPQKINLAVYNQANLADIRNNLFYTSSAMTHLYSAAALINPIVDHNCYNNVTSMFDYIGSVYSTVLDFNAATGGAFGFELHGIGGTVGLTKPSLDNFTLQSNSDCIGLGDSTDGVTEDYAGAPFNSPPASGAYAYP